LPLDGALAAMAPIGNEQASACDALNRLLVLAVGYRGIVLALPRCFPCPTLFALSDMMGPRCPEQ
jgi:hypothetical protein